MDITQITNADRQYSLFAILSPENAQRAEQALIAEGFGRNDVVRCYQGEADAKAFLKRHEGFVGTLRKLFVGHQIDVDKRYAKAARSGECVLKVHIGQERSAARDRAEVIILEAGGRDVYFFGEDSFRDVPKEKQQAVRRKTNSSVSD